MFGNDYGYNTPNQNLPLFSAKDYCVQNSEGSVNYNLSYRTETIQSTDGRRQSCNSKTATFLQSYKNHLQCTHHWYICECTSSNERNEVSEKAICLQDQNALITNLYKLYLSYDLR